MAPRKYRMGKRAEAVARTRRRIVEAAMALYQEQPVEMTSMQEVARRADVAPGTVSNHFGSLDELTEAVIEELIRTLDAPTESVFEGAAGVAERVRSLARALAVFYERAEPWFHVHEREHGRVAAFGEGARRFDERVDALIRAALGPRFGDRATRVVHGLMSPPVFHAMRRADGLRSDAAGDLVAEIIVAWLDDQQEVR